MSFRSHASRLLRRAVDSVVLGSGSRSRRPRCEPLESRRLLAWSGTFYQGAYGGPRGDTPAGVHYEWSPTSTYEDFDWVTLEPITVEYVGGYENEAVTLSLSGLPEHHTHVRLSDADAIASGPTNFERDISFSGTIGSKTIPMARWNWQHNVEDWGGQAVPAFPHKGSSIDVRITGSGLPSDWTWYPDGVDVNTFTPMVSGG